MSLTAASLEKRMRFLLETSRVVWRKPTKKMWAYMQPVQGQVTIALPPDQDDDYLLRYLFHELAHYALPGELAAFGVFEEDIIERVIEPRLIEHLFQRRKKHEWWIKKLRELKEAK